ncbi:MAG: C-GCAxxG-C-C family (seleno)protein [bacterium]|nr:C-GCAxxG-C-C family (seleno)protein [bacterium]
MSKFEQSRRDFLRIAGKGVMGAAAISAIPSVMQPALAEGVEAPAWPWEWKQIDKQKVLERTYASFSTHGGCCAAVVAGIVEELAEVYGYPYNQINPRMFANGGGGYGRKNLCGSLGGACAVLGLFCEGKDAGALRNELYTWYEGHEFPQYQPVMESVYTVSNSIQCADSVGNWMAASGKEFSSPERAARCAGLSAEVAVKVVELLNIKYGFEAAPVVEEAAPAAPALAANERIGVGKGFEGEVKVKVTKDGDKITKIEVLEQKESMPQTAMTDIPAAVIAAQSTEVDAIAGSTVSSTAILDAIKDALSQF